MALLLLVPMDFHLGGDWRFPLEAVVFVALRFLRQAAADDDRLDTSTRWLVAASS